MKLLSTFIFIAVAVLWACGDSTNPPSPFSPSAPSAVTAPPPSAAAPTAPTASPDQPGGIEVKVLSRDDLWTVEFTNSGDPARVGVACYEDPDRRIETQIFATKGRANLGTGETGQASAEIPCGSWQCDGFTGDAIEGAPFYGSRLLIGRIGRQGGDRCQPPPPCPNPPCNPPVCDEGNLEIEARLECGDDPFTLNPKACTFKCQPPVCDFECSSPFFLNAEECKCECSPELLQEEAEDKCMHGVLSIDVEECSVKCKPPPPQTCDERNPPRVENWTFNVTDTHITASLDCYNGACSADIWAGFPDNPNRWRKDPDDAHPKCEDGKKHVSVSYRHKGHSACLWRLEAGGPGFSFSKNVINRCDDVD